MGTQGFEPRLAALEAAVLPGWTTSPHRSLAFWLVESYLKVTKKKITEK